MPFPETSPGNQPQKPFQAVMHELMEGMFWGGLVMAIPPIILSVAVIVFVRKQQRKEAALTRESARD